MMHDKLSHVSDVLIAGFTTVLTATGTAVVAAMKPFDTQEEALRLLLPFIGAFVTCTGAWLLNPQPEHRKIVAGRAVIGLFCGIVSPSIAIEITPNLLPDGWMWMVSILSKPASLLAAGGIVAFTFYILSRPFFSKAYQRADAIAAAQVKRLEDLVKGPSNTVIVLDPSKLAPQSTTPPTTPPTTP